MSLKRQKRFIVIMIAMGSLFSPLSSNIYLPALNTLATDLDVSINSIDFTVTSFIIFQGLAPMFFGDMADVAGRRPVYIMCFTLYFFANIGLALQKNYAALLILRALQSTGSSGTIALANGVMADIVTSAERGEYIGWAQFGIRMGPALGPTIGGMLSQFLEWQAIFWFLAIFAGLYLAAYVVLVPETGRNVVGDGSIPPQGWNMSLINYIALRKTQGSAGVTSREQRRTARSELARSRQLRWPNPLRAMRILVEKDVCCLLLYGSLLISAFQCILVPFSNLLKIIYGFNDLQAGLCFM